MRVLHRVFLPSILILTTTLAFGQRLLLPKADPAAVANRICRSLYATRGNHYLPRSWGLLAVAVRLAPWWAFKRLRF